MSKLQESKLTGIEEIPKEWEVKQLGELFDFSGGMPFSRSSLGEAGFLYVHYGDIHKRNQNTFNTSNDFDWLPKIDIEMNKIKEYALLKTGDIVFADASEDYEGIGKSVVIVNNENKLFISGLHTIVAKDQTELLDIGYKKYFLIPNFVRNQFVKIATGATVFGISKANIKQIKTLVPPIPEQKKIAAIISSVEDTIEKIEAIIEQTERIKKGLMQQLFTKGIGHTKFNKTEIGEIPEAWELVQIQDIGTLKSGTTPSRSEQERYFESGTIPWIKTMDLNNGEVISTKERITDVALEETSLTVLPVNTVLVAMYGGFKQIGRTGLLRVKATINQALTGIIVNETLVNPYYLQLWLNAKVNYWKNFAASSRKDPNVTKSDVLKFPVALPTLSEQKKIVDILSSVNRKIENEMKKLSQLQGLKEGLMQSLLTGKVRVKIDEAEVTQV